MNPILAAPPNSPRRVPTVPFAGLEPLESRQLLVAYSADPVDFGHVPRELMTLAPPLDMETAGYGSVGVVLGDINADSVADFAVAAPGREGELGGGGIAAAVNGVVFIYSGADGAWLATIAGDSPGFGRTLASFPDANADGRPDLVVGSPIEGMIGIYSAIDGALIRRADRGPGTDFGIDLGVMDDLDAGGLPEIAVGAPRYAGHGAVIIITGENAAERSRIDGAQDGDLFGQSVEVVRDLGYINDDGDLVLDGFRDLAIAAPLADATLMTPIGDLHFVDDGWFALYDGVTGEVRDGDVMSNSLAPVSSLFWKTTDPATGEGVLYAQRHDGINIYELDLEDVFRGFHKVGGSNVSYGNAQLIYTNAGDVDGDGLDDFTFGVPGSKEVGLIGSDLTDPPSLPNRPGDRLLLGLGDTNGDGFADVLMLPLDGSQSVTVTSTTAFYDVPPISGVSRYGHVAFTNQSRSSGALPFGFLTRDGVLTSYDHVPGMSADFVVIALNDAGVIAGMIPPPPHSQEPLNGFETRVIVRNGVQRRLVDLITSVNGPSDYYIPDMTFKSVGPTGDVLLEERITGGTPRVWLLTSAGVLVFLWSGYAGDQAADGAVLGTQRESLSDFGFTKVWTAAGGVLDIPGLFNAVFMSDDHVIFGTDGDNNLAVVRDGRLTLVARTSSLVDGVTQATWTMLGGDSAGRGVARLDWTAVRARTLRGFTTYVIDTTNAIETLSSRVVIGDAPSGLDSPPDDRNHPASIRVTGPGGVIVIGSDSTTRLFTVASPDAFNAGTRGVRSASNGPAGMHVVAINPDGVPIAFRLQGGQWRGRALTGLSGTLSPDGDLAVFVDPKDGKTYAVTIGRVTDGDRAGNSVVTLYSAGADGTFGDPVTLNDSADASTGIVSHLAAFVSADSRVYVAGLNQSGQLVIFSQTGKRRRADSAHWEWAFSNIENNDLAPQGRATPVWADDLSVYVAPWNGLNISGLTADGDVAVVWWAPGQERWAVDNLSDVTGLPSLVGGLTSYVTAWGGLNVAGVDSSGDLQVVWWVPGPDAQWRSSNMTQQFHGQRLNPDTVSSYVTPWGGLNIAGMDAQTGTPVVYWWAPTMIDWSPASLTVQGGPQSDLPTGRLVFASSGQQLNLFGRADSGAVVRLSWKPGDGSTWSLENVSSLAT